MEYSLAFLAIVLLVGPLVGVVVLFARVSSLRRRLESAEHQLAMLGGEQPASSGAVGNVAVSGGAVATSGGAAAETGSAAAVSGRERAAVVDARIAGASAQSAPSESSSFESASPESVSSESNSPEPRLDARTAAFSDETPSTAAPQSDVAPSTAGAGSGRPLARRPAPGAGAPGTSASNASASGTSASNASASGTSASAGSRDARPHAGARTASEWEQLVGGRLLNRIGALALIIGVGFFLKYAFDRAWITETMRVLMGGGLGVVMLALGERSHRKGYDVFGQGLVGAGISILYLSIYSSFNFYHLVPQIAAFALMSAVTATAVFFALRRNSLAIALLGWAGGFLTPIMLSTGSANEVGLFTYLLVLDAGLIAAAWRRPSWSIIETLSVIATWVIYFAWHEEYFAPVKLAPAVLFASLFWALFHALDLARILRRPAADAPSEASSVADSDSHAGHVIVALASAGAIFAALFISIMTAGWGPQIAGSTKGESGVMIASIVLGLAYLASGALLERRGAEAGGRDRFYTTTLAALAAGLGIGLSNYVAVLAWIGLASAAIVFARRRPLPLLGGSGLILLFLAAAHLTFVDDALGSDFAAEYTALVSLRTLTWLTLAAAFGFAARLRDDAREPLAMLLDVSWTLALFGLVTVELQDWVSFRMPGSVFGGWAAFARIEALVTAAGWGLLGLAITAIARRGGRVAAVYTAQAMVALGAIWIAITGLEVYDAPAVSALLNIRGASLVLLVAILVLDARLLARLGLDDESIGWIRASVRVAVILAVLELASVEVRDHFERRIAARGATITPSIETPLRNAQQLALSGVWLAYSLLLIGLGIWRRSRPVRIVALLLFAVTILKIFLYDLSFLETLYRIVSFMGLGVILLIVSWLFQRYRDAILGGDAAEPPPA